ncbi:UNVERIFIED_CONTAM: hypothetical protein NCL1_19154 [Trichonephila clavipes]
MNEKAFVRKRIRSMSIACPLALIESDDLSPGCLHTVLADILLPDATEWSATSCGTEILLLLRAERAIKRTSADVVARGRPGTCLLHTVALVSC